MNAPKVNWNVWKWVGLFVLAAACLALLAQPGGGAAAQPIKMPTFASPVAQLCASTNGNYTDITIKNVQGLYGTHLKVTFDPTQGQVQAIEVPAGSVFASPAVVGEAKHNNASGEIEFIATRENPQAAYDNMTATAGVVFRIRWQSTAAEVTIPKHVQAVPPTPPQLADRDGMDLNYNGCVNGCTISGQVLLQGHTDPSGQRPDHSGTDIMLSTEKPCPAANQVAAMFNWPGVVMTKTNSLGNFSISGKTCGCLVAFKHGYLTAQGAPPSGTGAFTIPTVTLLGGDATQDDKINIFDLALVASHYGESHPANPDAAVADINGDGKVDIYDLTLTAGNSGKNGPLAWTWVVK